MSTAAPLRRIPSNNALKQRHQSQSNVNNGGVSDENTAPSNAKHNSMDVKSLMDKMKSKAGIKPYNDQITPAKHTITGPGWVKMPAFPSPVGVADYIETGNHSSSTRIPTVNKPVVAHEKPKNLEEIINYALITTPNVDGPESESSIFSGTETNLSDSLTEDEANAIITSIDFPIRKKKKQYISENLLKIVCSGNLNGLQAHIKPTDADLRDKNGLTLLHLSCMLGHIYITQYLVQVVGANVDAQDKLGLTPLHFACKGLHLITVRYLVMFCGCNLTLTDSLGRLPTTLCGSVLCDKNAQYILEILLVIQGGLDVASSDRSKVLRV